MLYVQLLERRIIPPPCYLIPFPPLTSHNWPTWQTPLLTWYLAN
jgi:hypothetical protein